MRAGASPSRIANALWAADLITPKAMVAAVATIIATGVNLAALVGFAARRFGDRPALVDRDGVVTFRQLARETDRMATALRDDHGIRPADAVGILCRNGAGSVRAIFAAARIGARIVLLNIDMAPQQIGDTVTRHRCVLVITGDDGKTPIEGSSVPAIAAAALLAASPDRHRKLGRVRGSDLVVLTGGTTGPPKAAARRPAAKPFLLLFLDLITTLDLGRRDGILIAVPLFHGYGIAASIMALVLGRTAYFMPRFQADPACDLIARHRIEALAVVPLMLQRMLAVPDADLASLRLVITGGAALPPPLAVQTRARLGDILFNLYGSSEAGLIALATPDDLADAPETIGRPFWGVDIGLLDDDDRPVAAGEPGRFLVSSAAAVDRQAIETGDIGYRDAKGRLFILGRRDEMISSGGEKLHPWEIETAILEHPEIAQAAVIGVDDAEYGQRAIAFVVPATASALTTESLAAWLAPRVARFQRPREIMLLDALPFTAAGKPDKRALRDQARVGPYDPDAPGTTGCVPRDN